MLTGLAPLVSSRTRLLVLGSFPGAASLAAQQYYAYPRNQFWTILQGIWPDYPIGAGVDSYEIRSDWLLARGLGLWDVYATCEREGSLDARIRRAQLNDFAGLADRCPSLEAIAHNGGESFKHASAVSAALSEAGRRATKPAGPETALQHAQPARFTAGRAASENGQGAGLTITFHRLPSTSPAHASWTFERKLGAWRAIFQTHGLV